MMILRAGLVWASHASAKVTRAVTLLCMAWSTSTRCTAHWLHVIRQLPRQVQHTNVHSLHNTPTHTPVANTLRATHVEERALALLGLQGEDTGVTRGILESSSQPHPRDATCADGAEVQPAMAQG